MTPEQLLLAVLQRGVQLWREGAALKFRAPKGALQGELLEQLRARKDEIAAQLEEGCTYAVASYAQERLWFLDRLAGGQPIYNMSEGLFRFHGKVEAGKIESALRDIFQRHELLRTRFSEFAGLPVQVIERNAQLEFEAVDLRQSAEPNDEALQLAAGAVHQRFDLRTGPLFKALLYLIADDESLLVLPMHHIVFDGWSLGVLIRELSCLYEGGELPPLPLSYADFAHRQRDALEQGQYQKELAYWRERLGDLPPLVELPADHPRPAAPAYRGRKVSINLPHDWNERVQRAGQAQGATPFMTLLAGYFAFLYHYTRETDLVVGSPIAGRTILGTGDLIGFFVNSAGLRARVDGGASFAALLRQVRGVVLDAFANQSLPFEKVVELLQPERDLTGNPFFRTMFVLENAPFPEMSIAGGKFEPEVLPTAAAKMDLTFALFHLDGTYRLTVEYDADLFDADTIAQWMTHYTRLVEVGLDQPDVPLAVLPFLSETETCHLLDDLNNTARAFDISGTALDCFESCAAQSPDALAIEEGGDRLTYAALQQQSDALARALSARGLGTGDIAVVLLERGAEGVKAALAAWKCGAAYLPIDPAYPAGRIGNMLEDSGARIVITTRCLAHLAAGAEAEYYYLDEPTPAVINEPVRGSRPTGDTLAYVIFTSGSTGRPKGVMVKHRALMNLIRWHQAEFELGPADRTSQVAGPAFDAAVWEIWPTLSIGASLHFAPVEARDSCELMRDWMLESGITVGFLPTPLAEACLDIAWPGHASLRYLLTGGDRLTRHPRPGLPFVLVNNYGPTENTVVSTSARLSAYVDGVLPSIGVPIANTRARVLNEHHALAPLGAPGELYVSGDSLADGYVGKPGLTTERFITIGYPNGEVERSYATGDLVRWRKDGALDFLGRTDQQVKVRGFRIELGEIEAVLRMHPQVRETAVIAAPDAQGGARLVAYVVPRDEDAVAGATHGDGVLHWQELYDATYASAQGIEDATLNITGWNSSYTGGPIPPADMEEWVLQTVAWAGARPLRRVLEIGCGTGMLLARLAPKAESYEAWDFSKVALQGIRGFIMDKPWRDHVTLRQKLANEIESEPVGTFDTILMNSVIQYFPSPEYFIEVLRHAARVVGPGGRILVGDVRSRELLETYAASVELFQAAPETLAAELRQRIERRARHEEELVLSPAFFLALAAQVPGIEAVEISPKWGGAVNELTRFRYQVVLHLGDVERLAPRQEITWTSEADIAARLRDSSEPLLIRDIPNARLDTERGLLAWLDTAGDSDTVATFRELAAAPGMAPDAVMALARAHNRQVRLDWSRHDANGNFDALFVSGETSPDAVYPARAESHAAPETLCNRPLQVQFLRNLAPLLQDHLRNYLPGFMVPGAFIAIERIPLTPNGKVDRKALPSPERDAFSASDFVAPRNSLEQQIADIWKQLLSVERIGVRDDFFALGGHSLLATQLASRLREATGVDLPIRAFFQHPTITQQALLLAEGAPGDDDAITPAPRDAPLPLSFSQRRLWFLYRLDPDSTAYNIPVALRLSGSLNHAALEASLRALVERHESLRTSFPLRGEEAVQLIAPASAFALDHADLSGAADGEEMLRRLIDDETERVFDIERGPLFCATLARLGAEDHALLLNMHHIISDGWSAGILMDELTRLYQAHASGAGNTLPPLPVQYADYAVWQQLRLRGERLDTLTQYWVDYLGGDVPPLELPTDFPRPRRQRFSGALHRFSLPADIAQGLRGVATRGNATLFMALLASLKVLFHRWSGQADFAVGTPIANRTRGEVEGLAGFFVNTLVMRTPIRPAEAFRDFLDRVRTGALGAYAHQDMPFERLVEVIDPARDPGRMPLYQVMFVFENMPRVQLEFKSLRIETIEIRPGTAKADLNIHLEEFGDELRGYVQYDTDLFAEETVVWMIGRWARLLESIVANEAAAVGALALYTASEIRTLPENPCLESPHSENWPFDPSACASLVEAVDAWTQTAPEQIFWQAPERTCTYGEFAAIYLRIAQALRARQTGGRIALYFEKGPEAIAAMIAALRTGIPYVPLDPGHPETRLQLIVSDASVDLVLTLGDLTAEASSRFTGATVVDVQALPDSGGDFAPASGEVAYIMYTSGSTGTPKGVVQTPGNMLHFVREYTRMLGLSPRDRLSFIPGYTVDAAIMDAGGALWSGATVVPTDLLREGMDTVARRVAVEGVTVLHMTPSVFRVLMLEYPEPDHYLTVRAVVLGGEETRPSDWELFREVFPADCTLVNLYGQTESSFIAYRLLKASDAETGSAVPIGLPIPGATLHLCAPDGEDSEPHGEIVIASPYLSRGYHNDRMRNAQVFSEGADGVRRYRTGDYGRRRADGAIVFMGRVDDQRKVRGYRVELAEVEAVLRAAPSVHEAAAAVQGTGTAQEQLAAWVSLKQDAHVTRDLVLQHCRDRLPAYMIPGRLTILPAIPKTATGKLDRKRLLEQHSGHDQESRAYTPPRTDTEQRLADIWRELLDAPRAGSDDSFFDLGGHSLLATRLASRIRAIFDVELPLQRIFDDPRLSAIAAEIDALRREGQDDGIPPLLPRIAQGPLPLSFSQQRLWFLDQLDPGQSVYNMTGAIRLSGALDEAALVAALSRIVERHETLRTTFIAEDGVPRQIIHAPAPFHLDVEYLPEHGAEAEACVAAWGELPFDLAEGPPLRVRLFKRHDDEHLLVLTLHHIAGDGWSVGRLMQELATLYAARIRRTAPRLPHLPVQYADYALWQRAWLQGQALDRQLGYWRGALEPLPPPLELPTDRPRPALQTYRGALRRFVWPPALLVRVQAFCRDAGVTPFMFSLAVLQVVLYRWSGQGDIVIGSPIANRTRRETENLIGFFLNTLLMRGQVRGNMPFDELLRNARESALGAYAHQDLPFEKLVEALAPTRDLSRMPLFQVMLVFQNTPSWRLDLPGLRSEMVEIDPATTKLDLNLHLRETARGLEGLVQYASDLFDPETIDTFIDALRRHVEFFSEQPAASVDAAPWTAINAGESSRCGRLPNRATEAVEGRLPTYRRETLDALREIWEGVLGRTGLPEDAHFFDYGGHSLQATQVIARIEKRLGVKLSVRRVFEQPTLAGLAAAVDAAQTEGGQEIPRAPRTKLLEPGHAQQRLWFLEKLTPGTSAYHITGAIRLRGALNLEALRQAFHAMIRRHESLRSAFVQIEGKPRVRLDESVRLGFEIEEIPNAEALPEHLRAFNDTPFDLGKPPLLRARLFRLAPDDHCLALVIHHIISDGWSIGVLARDLGELYAAALEERVPRLPSLPLQYVDYAAWQRADQQSPENAAQLRLYVERLTGIENLDLPLDYARPALQRFEGTSVSLALPVELTAGVEHLCRQGGLTPFMVYLGAYALLLSRYARQREFAIAVPVANRGHAGLDDLIGFFVNTLALRVPVHPEHSFETLLEETRERVLEAFDASALPFELLVKELNPERDTSRMPITQVAFAMQNTPAAAMAMPGLDIERVELEAASTRYDLELHIRERSGQSHAVLFYSTSLFAADTMRQFLDNWMELLRQLCKTPALPVGNVHGAAAAYLDSLRDQHERSRTGFPSETGIHALVAEQARLHPNCVAIDEAGRALTYAELDEKSARLAQWLREQGVSMGDRVATYMDRSSDLVLWLLAILRSGAAYVPLDTAYPAQRVQFMLHDSGAKLLLTVASLRKGLPNFEVPVFDATEAAKGALQSNGPGLEMPAGGDGPAYLMYTSGSTGIPKGVVVPHRAIARLVRDTDYIDIQPGDTVAHLSNTSFDAATFEIWGALCNGGRLLVLSRETVLNTPVFLQILREQQVASLFITTALFNQIARIRPDGLQSLREVLFGGEAVDPDAVRAVLEAGAPRRLLHVYGPTECTTFATWFEVKAVSPEARTIPIGWPIANTTAYVLGDAGQPMPPGVPGELYLGGPGVAMEYHGRQTLTAERFLPDPFASAHTLMYRTGDLVRKLHGGVIEFLSRLDGQVKLRGFRIELGEVEAELRRLGGLRDAAAMVREDRPGDRRLVAYVVSDANAAHEEASLQRALGASLPRYMVPSHIVAVEAIPLTPNGKVDWRALPAPQPGDAAPSAGLGELSPAESAVAEVWANVLGTSPPDRDASFFDVGGDSLLLMEFTAKLEAAVNATLPLEQIFQSPTLGAIALVLQKQAASPGEATAPSADKGLAVTLRAEGDGLPLFCIAPAGGTIYPYYALTHKLAPGYPVFGLMDPAFKRGDEPHETIEAMARDYIDTMRAIQPHGPYRLIGWSFGGLVAFEIARQLHAAGESIAHVGIIEFRIPDQHETTAMQRLYAAGMSVWHNLAHMGSTIGNLIDGLLVSIAYAENITKKQRVLKTPGEKLAGWIVGWSWKLLLKQSNLANVLTRESQMMLIKHPSTKNFARISGANLRAMHRYEMCPYDGDVVLYRASNQPSEDHNREVLEGWRGLVQGRIDEHIIRGDHFSIMRHPDVKQLARALEQRLARI